MSGETAGAGGPPVLSTCIEDCQREIREHSDSDRRKNEQKSDEEDI